jgi:hypothetical protein
MLVLETTGKGRKIEGLECVNLVFSWAMTRRKHEPKPGQAGSTPHRFLSSKNLNFDL